VVLVSPRPARDNAPVRNNAGRAGAPEPLVVHRPEPQRTRPAGGSASPLRASRGFALGLLLSASLWGLIIILVRGLLSHFR
jgi:hypothetical protein